MFYLTTHSTHFIYGYMASDIWLRTILIVRKETRCRHIGYSYRLTARVLLYAPSNRQDNTYHGLCYTSRGALAGTRNSSMTDWMSNTAFRVLNTWITDTTHVSQRSRVLHKWMTDTSHVSQRTRVLNNWYKPCVSTYAGVKQLIQAMCLNVRGC